MHGGGGGGKQTLSYLPNKNHTPSCIPINKYSFLSSQICIIRAVKFTNSFTYTLTSPLIRFHSEPYSSSRLCVTKQAIQHLIRQSV